MGSAGIHHQYEGQTGYHTRLVYHFGDETDNFRLGCNEGICGVTVDYEMEFYNDKIKPDVWQQWTAVLPRIH